jgi:hypothetical protein
MVDRPLGRRPPTDDRHIQRYPLTVAALPQLPVPVVIGVNWYEAFDRPVYMRNKVTGKAIWGIGLDEHNLGRIRGGHCVCIKPQGIVDPVAWWRLMDQGSEGACVGFGSTRAMMLLNRRRYDARWLYHMAQTIDEWPGEDYDGTSVRAGMDVLRDMGHRRVRGKRTSAVDAAEGISENRWARSVEEVMACLQSPRYEAMGMVPILNSWGASYPHLTYMPLETLDRLIREDGEATIITDRIKT